MGLRAAQCSCQEGGANSRDDGPRVAELRKCEMQRGVQLNC